VGGTLGLFLGSHTIDRWLSGYGYPVVFVLVMVESLGVPVPGETALIAAALYAGSTHELQIWWVIAVAAAGAIIGDNIGFAIGRYGGARLLLRYGPKLRLDERKLKAGVWVFRRQGGKVVFFGRFVSILRTYAAFLAGTNRMGWPPFLGYNAAGGIVWSALFGLAYYEFGGALKDLTTTLDIVIGVGTTLILVGFLVWFKRREDAIERRAEQDVTEPISRALGVESDADDPAPTRPRRG
jgi:membrane protein DedA with SNARE-associated domain